MDGLEGTVWVIEQGHKFREHHCISAYDLVWSIGMMQNLKSLTHVWLQIILMSQEKYIQNTLTLPEQMPLFKYNINFDGLRNLLEDVNIKTNSNEEAINLLKGVVAVKLDSSVARASEQKINHSFVFGQICEQHIKKSDTQAVMHNRPELKDQNNVEQTAWKLGKMAEILEYLMQQRNNHEDRIANDDRRHEKMISESFRRLEDKIECGLASFSKTINEYFAQSNQKVSGLDSEMKTMKLGYQNKLGELQGESAKRITQQQLQSALESSELKIRKQLETDIKNDQMLRLAGLNEYSNKLKEVEKEVELRQKHMNSKVTELSQKVAKAMQVATFDLEKHKIYDRISEVKNKADDATRRTNQFVEFRKNYMATQEHTKQEFITLTEEINKLGQKGGNFQKMENVADMLAGLNPHLICEIGEQVKLHQKQIGLLEKKIMCLEQELRGKGTERPMPEVNSGQTTELILKTIKEYMANMDFEGRVKRNEKDVHQFKKRADAIHDLEKRIGQIAKDADLSGVHKELRKKCDEESTRREVKILDGKIEQLFEFYRQTRKDIDGKRTSFQTTNPESVSMTTKRLVSANCLSCLPSPASRRDYSRNKMDLSVEYNLDSHKSTLPVRTTK